MNKRLVFLLTISMVCLSAAFAGAGEVYYVQSVKAKVLSETSFRAKVIAEVNKGYKFNSSGRTGNWIKVNHSGKTGYISSLLVSTHPPMEKTTLIKGGEGDINQGVRRRASTYTSAAAARGLTHEDRKRLSTEEEVNYKALEKMEALTLTNDEVTRFTEGSKL